MGKLGIRADQDVELRLHRAEQAEELYALADANREHLSPWMPWVEGTRSADDTRAFITEGLRRLAAGEEYNFEILHRGDLVGAIGLRVDRDAREGEIGYWLAEDALGKGIVTRASAALIDFAFDELGLHRVAILCGDDNVRSAAVPERLGFTLEGVLRERDHIPGRPPRDQRYYGLLRSEWDRDRATAGRRD